MSNTLKRGLWSLGIGLAAYALCLLTGGLGPCASGGSGTLLLVLVVFVCFWTGVIMCLIAGIRAILKSRLKEPIANH